MLQGSDVNNSLSSDSKLQKANQLAKYLSKVDTFTQSQILMSKILPRNKITYLDQHQFYAIIEGKYLKELLKKTEESSKKIYQLNQKLLQKQTQLAYIKSRLKLSQKRVNQLEQNQNKFIKKMKQNDQFIVNIKQQLAEKQANIINLIQLNNRANQSKMIEDQPPQIIINKHTNTQSVQCEYYDDIQQIKTPKLVEKHQTLNFNEEKQQKGHSKLVKIFQDTIAQIVNKMETKIQNLNEHISLAEQIKQKYEQVSEQNKKLKLQLRHINEAEQRMNLWKKEVSGFINRLEQNSKLQSHKKITHYYPDIIDQNQQKLTDKVQRLQRKLLQQKVQKVSLEIKFKKIQEIMVVDQQIGDDGIVGNLLKASQQIKLIVKQLLTDL